MNYLFGNFKYRVHTCNLQCPSIFNLSLSLCICIIGIPSISITTCHTYTCTPCLLIRTYKLYMLIYYCSSFLELRSGVHTAVSDIAQLQEEPMHDGSLSEDQLQEEAMHEAERETPLHAVVRKARRTLRQQREIRAASTTDATPAAASAASTTAPAPAASWTSSTTAAAATPAAAPAASSTSSRTAEDPFAAEGLRPHLQVRSVADRDGAAIYAHRCFFCELPIETERVVAVHPVMVSAPRLSSARYLVYHQNCFSWRTHISLEKRTGRIASPRELLWRGIRLRHLKATDKPLEIPVADSDAESE